MHEIYSLPHYFRNDNFAVSRRTTATVSSYRETIKINHIDAPQNFSAYAREPNFASGRLPNCGPHR